MYAGDTLILEITAKDSDGTALDLTGLTVKWSLARVNTSPALLTKTVGSGITVTNAALGQFKVELTPTDTASFSGEYYHEVRVFQGLKAWTIFSDYITFKPTLVR